jgi:hypothetical protein
MTVETLYLVSYRRPVFFTQALKPALHSRCGIENGHSSN